MLLAWETSKAPGEPSPVIKEGPTKVATMRPGEQALLLTFWGVQGRGAAVQIAINVKKKSLECLNSVELFFSYKS